MERENRCASIIDLEFPHGESEARLQTKRWKGSVSGSRGFFRHDG
jgi:hypothetical protein